MVPGGRCAVPAAAEGAPLCPAADGGVAAAAAPAAAPHCPRPQRGRLCAATAAGACAAVAAALPPGLRASLRHGDAAQAVPAAKMAAEPGFEFLAVGDWGDHGARRVGARMGRHSPAFVLGLGDNFYDVGVAAAEDPAAVDAQFADRFEQTFAAPPLRDVPWYVCAGNHDYYGGPTAIAAEIEYSKRSNRWVYPSLYFNRTYTDPASGVSALVVSVDTWRINGGDTYVRWHHRRGHGTLRSMELLRAHLAEGRVSRATHDQLVRAFWPPDPALSVDGIIDAPGRRGGEGSADDEQLRWLRTVLSESAADWKLVIGHFGVRSCAVHEHGDTPSLIEHLQPILEEYGVDVYFSGHDHILQHIELAGVHYIGSGAGARRHHGIDYRYPGLRAAVDGSRGYTSHFATKSSLHTAFHDEDGRRRYRHLRRRV